jgi:hypothetical protein
MAPLAPTKIRTKKENTKKQNDLSDVQPESSAEPKNSKTGSKPSSAIVPSISSTKPSKEKKPAQKKPELPTPTSISRPRSLQSSTVTVMEKKSKKSVPEPESSSGEEDDDGDQDEDDDGHLHGFSTDDDDSSDEEDPMDDEPSAFDVGKLPTIAKDDATIKHKLEKAKRQPVRLFLPLITKSLLILSPDGRPRCLVHWTSTSRVLRRSTQGILFTIWQCHPATCLSQ